MLFNAPFFPISSLVNFWYVIDMVFTEKEHMESFLFVIGFRPILLIEWPD